MWRDTFLQDFQKQFNCHFNFDGGIDRPGRLSFNSEGQQIIQCDEVRVRAIVGAVRIVTQNFVCKDMQSSQCYKSYFYLCSVK